MLKECGLILLGHFLERQDWQDKGAVIRAFCFLWRQLEDRHLNVFVMIRLITMLMLE